MKLRFSSGDIYLTQISSLSRARIRSKEQNNSKFTLLVCIVGVKGTETRRTANKENAPLERLHGTTKVSQHNPNTLRRLLLRRGVVLMETSNNYTIRVEQRSFVLSLTQMRQLLRVNYSVLLNARPFEFFPIFCRFCPNIGGLHPPPPHAPMLITKLKKLEYT